MRHNGRLVFEMMDAEEPTAPEVVLWLSVIERAIRDWRNGMCEILRHKHYDFNKRKWIQYQRRLSHRYFQKRAIVLAESIDEEIQQLIEFFYSSNPHSLAWIANMLDMPWLVITVRKNLGKMPRWWVDEINHIAEVALDMSQN